MTGGVSNRKYDTSRRRAAAEQARAVVLRAARDLFTFRGYAGHRDRLGGWGLGGHAV